MKSVNIHEAKTHLSRLVEAAAKGEPMVKVVPLEEKEHRAVRRLGTEGRWAGPITGDGLRLDESDPAQSAASLAQTLAMHGTRRAFADRTDAGREELLAMPQRDLPGRPTVRNPFNVVNDTRKNIENQYLVDLLNLEHP